MGDQRGEVGAQLAERRDSHRHYVEPVIKILAKALLGNFGGQVARRARDDADVDADHRTSPDTGEALLGQDAQDFALRGQRHVGDLVEEERAAMRLFEQADANRPRSEEHTSELQSLMRISYAVFCLKKKSINKKIHKII